MEGGRVPPILSLDASSSWANMEIRIQERVGMHRQEDSSPHTPLSPTTSRLPREDMSIYGSVPSTDPMQLVVCKWCGRAVKDTAMLRHQELHHPSAKNTPLLLDKITHPSNASRNALVKEQKAERKKKSSKGKDHYDPDRHCGVWLVDEKRNCLRSLTCKYHSLSLRRQVKDRSKPFDELLMLHKEQKRGKSLSQGVVNSQPTIQGAQPVSDNVQVSTLLDSAALPSCQVPPAFAELWVEELDTKQKDSTTTQPSTTGSLSHSSTHPKPLACCKWRTRTVGGGHLLFNRRQDQLYTSLTKLATGNSEDSVGNSTTVAAHRKHVFSLLQDEREKRKSIVSSSNYQLNNFHVLPTNSNMELLLEKSSWQTHNSIQLFDDGRSPSASSSIGESSSFQFPFPKCMAEEQQSTEKRNSMVAPAKLPKASKKRRRSSSEQNNSAAQSSSRSNSISVSPFEALRDISQPFMSLADMTCHAAVTMVTTMTTANHQVQDGHFTFPTTVEPPVDVNKEDQKLPTTPEDFNSMISKMMQQQQPQPLPLPQPIVFNGMIAGTPGGLLAAMPPQPTAGTVPGSVLSLHSTTPTGLSPPVAQFNPGNMAMSPHQLFPGVIPQASYHESLVDKPQHSTANIHQYLQDRIATDRIATGQMINFNNQHSSFFVPKQPTSYHPHTFNMLNTRRADNSNTNCNNSLEQENGSNTCESELEPLLQFATSFSSDDKQSELSLFDSKNMNLEQISDQQQVT